VISQDSRFIQRHRILCSLNRRLGANAAAHESHAILMALVNSRGSSSRSVLIAPAASVPAIVASRPAVSAFYVPCGIFL
jgi:hypothetical protein